MADIKECKKWLDEARPLLGMSDGRKMGKRTKELAELLKSMEKIVKKDPPKYPILKSKTAFENFEKEYKKLLGEFEQLAKSADNSTSKGDVKEVAAKLRNLKQNTRLALGKARPTESNKVKNQLLDSARNEPVYREVRKQTLNTIEQLKSIPGTKVEQERLQRMLNAAESRLPDFYRACGDLEFFTDLELGMQGEGLKRVVIEARKTANELPGKLFQKPDFAIAYRQAEDLLNSFTRLASVSDPANVDKYSQLVPKILNDAHNSKDESGGLSAIRKAVQELTTLRDDCVNARQSVKTPKEKVTKQWEELGDKLALSKLAVLKSEKERAETLESCQLFKQAKKAYEDLGQRIDVALQSVKTAPKTWEELQPEILEMEKALKEAESVPELSSVMNQIRTAIEKARGEVSMNQDYIAASDGVVALREDVKALKKGTKAFTENDGGTPPTVVFPDHRRTAQVKLNGFSTKVRSLLDDVKAKELKELVDAGGDPAPFLAQIDQIMKDVADVVVFIRDWFEANYGKAKGKTKKQQVLKQLIDMVDKVYKDPAMQDAKDLSGNIRAVMKNGGKLKQSQEQAILNKNKEKSLAAIKLLQKVMDEYDVLQLPDDRAGAKLLKKVSEDLKDLKTRANKGENIVALAEIHMEDLRKQKQLVETEIQQRRDQAAKEAKILNEKIDKLEKEDPKYEAYFNSLRVEVGVAASKLSSQVSSVSGKGAQSLKDIDQKILKVKATMKDDSQNYTAVDKKVKSLKSAVEDVKKKDRREHARLEHAFSEVLVPSIRKLNPEAALDELKKFETGKLKTAQDAADKTAKDLEQFKKDATTFKNTLNSTKLKSTAPSLYRTLMARREEAKTAAVGNLDFAKNELAAMQLLMDTAKDDEVKAAKLDLNAEEEEFADQRRKQEYLAAKEIFVTNFKQQASFSSGDRRNEYEAMKRMAAQADKMADKTPADYAGARESLNRAVEMAKFLLENPDDDSAPRGRSLRKLNANWKSRVSTYLQEVSDLISSLDGATDEDDVAVDTTAAQAALEPLLSQFDPRAFDKYIEVLSRAKPKLELNERRKTKEEVLVRIRRSQAKLKNNSVLKYIAGNTVSNVTLRPLVDTLRGLEAEVLGL